MVDKAELKGLFPGLDERAIGFLMGELRVLDQSGPTARSSHGDRITNALNFSVLIEHVRAIKRFDKASTQLATRIYWLTWVLVILTVAMTVFTILLWGRP
jgi:hypothetical protein